MKTITVCSFFFCVRSAEMLVFSGEIERGFCVRSRHGESAPYSFPIACPTFPGIRSRRRFLFPHNVMDSLVLLHVGAAYHLPMINDKLTVKTADNGRKTKKTGCSAA